MSKADNMDLSYFMEGFKSEEVEYPAPERFKDKDGNRINLVFRTLSEEEQREIRNHHRHRKLVTDPKTKRPIVINGTVAMDETYDSSAAMQELLVESLVYPNLKDKSLMKNFNCYEAIKMPLKVFPTSDELVYVYNAFNEIHGYVDDESDEQTAENSDIENAKN